MRFLAIAFLLVVQCCGTTQADEIKPVPDPINDQIHLPTTPVTVEPYDPKPEEPSTVIGTLSADQFYVIESTAKLITLSSPEGLVSFEETPGPIRVRGLFVDGSGKIETRTYNSPYVYFVTAVASGKTELILIPEGVTSQDDIVRQVLTVSGIGPRPGPVDPVDPDDPPIPPVDPPILGKENRVLVIYESSDLPKYPPAQTAVFAASSLREYLNKKCVKGPDGKTPEFRIWDKDVDTSNVSTVWQDAMKLQRQSLPWIIVSNGSTGFSGPLPTDVDSTVTLLKKYLGD